MNETQIQSLLSAERERCAMVLCDLCRQPDIFSLAYLFPLDGWLHRKRDNDREFHRCRAAAIRALPPLVAPEPQPVRGAIVQVNHPSYHGLGFVQHVNPACGVMVGVILEHGNVRWYEAETVSAPDPAKQLPRWIERLTTATIDTAKVACTCPTDLWVGSEPNDSTCTLTDEEHLALTTATNTAKVEKQFRCDDQFVNSSEHDLATATATAARRMVNVVGQEHDEGLFCKYAPICKPVTAQEEDGK